MPPAPNRSMKTTAQIIRDYRGPALFSFGFRPFFLLGTIWSALAVPLWMLGLFGVSDGLAAIFTRDWHVHEMLFGYTSAIIAGYLIVAGANWTGRYPVAGRPVMLLVALWVAGRAAMLTIGTFGIAGAAIEAAFLIVFALALWREQIAASNWRSVAPCIIVSLLAAANLGFHSRLLWPEVGALAERMGLSLIIFLIVLMGGRLVPSFTRNWMAQRKLKPEPAAFGRADQMLVGFAGVALSLWMALPSAAATGSLLVAAGTGLLIRLVRWRGWLAASDPMILILHIGYGWCALGLVLLGASILWSDNIPTTAAVHALTTGAIGVMTLAMLTRTSRSHTGRERRADEVTLVIYWLINAAAIMRVMAPFWIAAHLELLALSTACWFLAFGLFAIGYGPMLMRPWRR